MPEKQGKEKKKVSSARDSWDPDESQIGDVMYKLTPEVIEAMLKSRKTKKIQKKKSRKER